jgi:hypothetical protein
MTAKNATSRGPKPGREQDRAYPDEHRHDGECGVQSELVGEAAQQVGGGDNERAGK